MKTCAICLTESQDDAATCTACGEASWLPANTEPTTDTSSDADTKTPRKARK